MPRFIAVHYSSEKQYTLVFSVLQNFNVYRHLAVLGNSQDQYLIIAGEIPNPGPKTAETWVETFKAVDDGYREIFRRVVATIRVG